MTEKFYAILQEDDDDDKNFCYFIGAYQYKCDCYKRLSKLYCMEIGSSYEKILEYKHDSHILIECLKGKKRKIYIKEYEF